MYNRSTSVYFALPFKFKRQSESLQLKIKDKNLKALQKSLEQKKKVHAQAQKIMRDKQIRYQAQLTQKKKQYEALIEIQMRKKANIRRLQIRRDLLRSRKDGSIIHRKANIIKKYLLSAPYTIGQTYQAIASFGNIQDYHNAQKKILGILNRKLVVQNLKKIVYLRRMIFEKQQIILCIKEMTRTLYVKEQTRPYLGASKTWSKFYQKDEDPLEMNSIFHLLVYSTSKPYFCLERVYNYEQLLEIFSKIIQDHRISNENLHQNIHTLNKKSVRRPSLADKVKIQAKTNILADAGEILSSMKESQVSGSIFLQTNLQNIDECNQSQSKDGTFSILSNELKDPLQIDSDEGKESQFSRSAQSSLTPKNTGPIKSKKFKYPGEDLREFKHLVLKSRFLGGLQRKMMPQSTPLINIIILKGKRQLFWIPQYLELEQKQNIIRTSAKKWKLKMTLQQKVKNYLLYRIITIDRFYESEIGTMEPQKILFLMTIKKQPETNDYYLTCENIKSQKPEFTFLIKEMFYKNTAIDSKVNEKLRSSINKSKAVNRRSKELKRKSSLKPVALKKQEKSPNTLTPTPQVTIKQTLLHVLNYYVFLQQMQDKFQIFLTTHRISIAEKKFLKMVNFQENEEHILKLQAYAKCKFRKIQYAKMQKNKCTFNYNPQTKILISIVHYRSAQLTKAFIESLQSPPKTKITIQSFPLKYSTIVDEICRGYSIRTAKQDFSQTLSLQVEKYQKQLQRLQAEKPQRYKNVIRRFMMKIYLHVRAKKNIFYVKKLPIGDKIFALVIKRSTYFSKMIQCNLYELIIKKEIVKQSKQREKQDNSKNSFFKSLRQNFNPSRMKAHIQYQTIHLFQNYFQGIPKHRIWEQFYITSKSFLVKPKRKKQEHYIQRIVPLDINCEQILKQISNYEREDNERSKGNFYVKEREKSLKNMLNKLEKQNCNKSKKISIEENHEVANNLALAVHCLSNSGYQESSSNAIRTNHRSSSNKCSKTFYRILNNHHEGIIYYCLLKSEDIYFYLDIYSVAFSPPKNGKQTQKDSYSQQFIKIHRQRLFRKQLTESTLSLVHCRIAKWLKYNQDDVLMVKEVIDQREGNHQFGDERDFISSDKCLKLDAFSSLYNLPKIITKLIEPQTYQQGIQNRNKMNTLMI